MINTIEFWKGQFGNEYSARNTIDHKLTLQRTTFWKKVLSNISSTNQINNVLEVGCNVGLNLTCLSSILMADFFAIEPNATARDILLKKKILDETHLKNGLAHDIPFNDEQFDFVFTSGVLIHVHPSQLEKSISEIYRVSKKYIVCCEYFADSPTEINYRGYEGVLFKRDFGSLYMDMFPNLRCINYGFEWKRLTGEDNSTWWLFEK